MSWSGSPDSDRKRRLPRLQWRQFGAGSGPKKRGGMEAFCAHAGEVVGAEGEEIGRSCATNVGAVVPRGR